MIDAGADPKGPSNEPDPNWGFVWVGVAVAIVTFYVTRSQTHDFKDFKPTDWLALDAAVVGVATIVLVGFQIVIALRQTALAKEQTELSLMQTKVLLRQDEIISRIEKLSLSFNSDRDVDTLSILDVQNAGSQTIPLVLFVRNYGFATCREAYLSLYIDTALPIIFNDAPGYMWIRSPVRAVGPNATLHKYERTITYPIFPGRAVRAEATLTIPNGQATYPLLWDIASEHGTWPPQEAGANVGQLLLQVAAP
jgi:hypothetical protein